MDQSPIVITGCPRSGTQMMGRIFGNLSPDFFLVTEHSEKETDIPEDRSGVEDHQLWWDHFSYDRWDAEKRRPIVEVPSVSADAALRLRARYTELAAGRRIVVKNPSHILYPQVVRQVFPDARFVYCARNPWPTLQSMTKKGHESFLLRSPRTDCAGMSLLLRAAIGWSDAMASYFAARDDRWTVAQYERIVESPREEIARICSELNVDRGEGFERAASIPKPSHNSNFFFIKNAFRRSPDRERIVEELKRGCEYFGYPPSPEELEGSFVGHALRRITRRLNRRAA